MAYLPCRRRYCLSAAAVAHTVAWCTSVNDLMEARGAISTLEDTALALSKDSDPQRLSFINKINVSRIG